MRILRKNVYLKTTHKQQLIDKHSKRLYILWSLILSCRRMRFLADVCIKYMFIYRFLYLRVGQTTWKINGFKEIRESNIKRISYEVCLLYRDYVFSFLCLASGKPFHTEASVWNCEPIMAVCKFEQCFDQYLISLKHSVGSTWYVAVTSLSWFLNMYSMIILIQFTWNREICVASTMLDVEEMDRRQLFKEAWKCAIITVRSQPVNKHTFRSREISFSARNGISLWWSPIPNQISNYPINVIIPLPTSRNVITITLHPIVLALGYW